MSLFDNFIVIMFFSIPNITVFSVKTGAVFDLEILPWLIFYALTLYHIIHCYCESFCFSWSCEITTGYLVIVLVGRSFKVECSGDTKISFGFRLILCSFLIVSFFWKKLSIFLLGLYSHVFFDFDFLKTSVVLEEEQSGYLEKRRGGHCLKCSTVLYIPFSCQWDESQSVFVQNLIWLCDSTVWKLCLEKLIYTQ